MTIIVQKLLLHLHSVDYENLIKFSEIGISDLSVTFVCDILNSMFVLRNYTFIYQH